MHTKKPTKVITRNSKDLSIIYNSMCNQFLRYKSFKRGVKIQQQVQIGNKDDYNTDDARTCKL